MNINSSTTINVAAGTEITALFGVLTIQTVDSTRAWANSTRKMGAFSGNNKSRGHITAKATSDINLGSESSNAKQAYLNGKRTQIISDMRQELKATAVSQTGAADSKTRAYARIYSMDNEQIINLYNVFVGGIEMLTIQAVTSAMDNKAYADAYIAGATGTARAEATVQVNKDDAEDAVVAKIYVSSDADVAGWDVMITQPRPTCSSIRKSTARPERKPTRPGSGL